jgi:hypothetical protein
MRGILLTACAAAAAAPPISPFKLQSSKLYLPLSLSPSRKRHPIYHVDYDLSFWAGPN